MSYDIVGADSGPMLVGNSQYPGYPLMKRDIYYCCHMILSQYDREFTSPRYEKIKKVYSIWICTNLPERRKNTITRYRLVEEYLVGVEKKVVRNYNLLSVTMRAGGRELSGCPSNDGYTSLQRDRRS